MMIGGDLAVAWVDKQTLQGYAIDYFLDAKSQCSGRRGSCPDTRIQVQTNKEQSDFISQNKITNGSYTHLKNS